MFTSKKILWHQNSETSKVVQRHNMGGV